MSDKDEFKMTSRAQAETKLEQIKGGNPIINQIAANKIWNDHLKRSGIKR